MNVYKQDISETAQTRSLELVCLKGSLQQKRASTKHQQHLTCTFSQLRWVHLPQLHDVPPNAPQEVRAPIKPHPKVFQTLEKTKKPTHQTFGPTDPFLLGKTTVTSLTDSSPDRRIAQVLFVVSFTSLVLLFKASLLGAKGLTSSNKKLLETIRSYRI